MQVYVCLQYQPGEGVKRKHKKSKKRDFKSGGGANYPCPHKMQRRNLKRLWIKLHTEMFVICLYWLTHKDAQISNNLWTRKDMNLASLFLDHAVCNITVWLLRRSCKNHLRVKTSVADPAGDWPDPGKQGWGSGFCQIRMRGSVPRTKGDFLNSNEWII